MEPSRKSSKGMPNQALRLTAAVCSVASLVLAVVLLPLGVYVGGYLTAGEKLEIPSRSYYRIYPTRWQARISGQRHESNRFLLEIKSSRLPNRQNPLIATLSFSLDASIPGQTPGNASIDLSRCLG